VKSATAYPTCRHDAVLKRTIEAIRTGAGRLRKTADGAWLKDDHADALAWLTQEYPGAKKRELIAKYRECEPETRTVLEEHWDEGKLHARALLDRGGLTAHWRRWARY
jgi:hypothetical protein